MNIREGTVPTQRDPKTGVEKGMIIGLFMLINGDTVKSFLDRTRIRGGNPDNLSRSGRPITLGENHLRPPSPDCAQMSRPDR